MRLLNNISSWILLLTFKLELFQFCRLAANWFNLNEWAGVSRGKGIFCDAEYSNLWNLNCQRLSFLYFNTVSDTGLDSLILHFIYAYYRWRTSPLWSSYWHWYRCDDLEIYIYRLVEIFVGTQKYLRSFSVLKKKHQTSTKSQIDH